MADNRERRWFLRGHGSQGASEEPYHMGVMDWVGETLETYRWSYVLAPLPPILWAGWPALGSPHLFLYLAILVYLGFALLTSPLL